MTARRTHGDGRHMTLAEASRRRANIIRFWGSLGLSITPEVFHGHGQQRRWSDPWCSFCKNPTRLAIDVALNDRAAAVSACATCRAARANGAA